MGGCKRRNSDECLESCLHFPSTMSHNHLQVHSLTCIPLTRYLSPSPSPHTWTDYKTADDMAWHDQNSSTSHNDDGYKSAGRGSSNNSTEEMSISELERSYDEYARPQVSARVAQVHKGTCKCNFDCAMNQILACNPHIFTSYLIKTCTSSVLTPCSSPAQSCSPQKTLRCLK